MRQKSATPITGRKFVMLTERRSQVPRVTGSSQDIMATSWQHTANTINNPSSAHKATGATTGAALLDNNETTAKSTSQDGGMAVNFG